MKKILLRGYYGYENSGDDALFYTIVQKISVQSDVIFTALAKQPLATPADVKVSFKIPTALNILKGILGNDVLIFGGGSQLQDYGKIRLLLSMLKTFMIVGLMKSLGKKVVYLGVSIGPLETRVGKSLGERILRKSDFIVVRDQSSYNFLSGLKLDKNKVRLVPDLAISLSEYNLSVEKKDKSKNLTLGINLLPFYKSVKNDSIKEERLVAAVAESINQVISEQPSVTLKLFSFQEEESINDYRILHKLNEKLTRKAEIIRYHMNPIEVFKEVSSCDRFMGMRLHSSIFAYANGIPLTILSYHPKCKGFAKSVGYNPEAVIDTDTINAESLTSKLRELIDHPEHFSPSIPASLISHEINNVYNELAGIFFNGVSKGKA